MTARPSGIRCYSFFVVEAPDELDELLASVDDDAGLSAGPLSLDLEPPSAEAFMEPVLPFFA